MSYQQVHACVLDKYLTEMAIIININKMATAGNSLFEQQKYYNNDIDI